MTLPVPVAMRAHVHSEHKLGVSAPVGVSIPRLRATADGFIISSFTYDDRPKPVVDPFSEYGSLDVVKPAVDHEHVCRLEREINRNNWFADFGSGTPSISTDLVFPSGYVVQKARQMGVSEWAKRHLTIEKGHTADFKLHPFQQAFLEHFGKAMDEMAAGHISDRHMAPKEQRTAPNYHEQGDNANKSALRFAKETTLGKVPDGSDATPLRKGIEIHIESRVRLPSRVAVLNDIRDDVRYEVREEDGQQRPYPPAWQSALDEQAAQVERDGIAGVPIGSRRLGLFKNGLCSFSLYANVNILDRQQELLIVHNGTMTAHQPRCRRQYAPASAAGVALKRAIEVGYFKDLPENQR